MSFQRIPLFCAALFAATMLNQAVFAQEANMPSRQTLLEKAVELPSNKINARTIKVVFSKGYKTPLHTHEGPGPRYVVKGKLKVEQQGQSHEYGPGEVFWETGESMTVENVGDGEAEMVIVELAPQK